MTTQLRNSILFVACASLSAGCNKSGSGPTGPSPATNSAIVDVAVTLASADAPTNAGAINYRFALQFRETGGRSAATISAVRFAFTGTQVAADWTPTTTQRVSAGGALASPTITYADNAGLTANAAQVNATATYTDEGGRTSTASAAASITRPPPIVFATVAGVVSDSATGRALGGASVRAVNSATQTDARGTTDGNGYYSLSGIGTGLVTLTTDAPTHNLRTETFAVTGDTRRDVALLALYARTGVGNDVFTMPTFGTAVRARITGTYRASGSNFIVWIGGRLIVNEIIGTGRPGGPTYSGVHLITGGLVEITNSRDVEWSIQQEK